jgi:hypothetical protein
VAFSITFKGFVADIGAETMRFGSAGVLGAASVVASETPFKVVVGTVEEVISVVFIKGLRYGRGRVT